MAFARLFMQIVLIIAIVESQHAYGQNTYTGRFKGENFNFP